MDPRFCLPTILCDGGGNAFDWVNKFLDWRTEEIVAVLVAQYRMNACVLKKKEIK